MIETIFMNVEYIHLLVAQ